MWRAERENGKSRTIRGKEKKSTHIQWLFKKRNKKRARGLQKRWREGRRATESAPAGAVCWEQVVYLGQHIASSAFPPTCLSKQGRGKPAR